MLGFVALTMLASILVAAGASRLLQRPPVWLGSFERLASLPPADDTRYINAIATLPDGELLVVGMYASSAPTWAYRLDPIANSWTAIRGDPGNRRLGTATTLPDGHVLLVGGWDTSQDAPDGQVVISPTMIYDPVLDTFRLTAGQPTTARLGHTATLLADGRVLIAGGEGPDFNAAEPQLASAEVFDPATETFTTVGDMITERQSHTATLLADGRVLITGGIVSRNTSVSTGAELFDPSTGRFTATGPMQIPRSMHAATALRDGRVLIAGGWTDAATVGGPNRTTAAAELFDPTTGTFTATGSLATERSNLTIITLPDGRVLAAGGLNDRGAPRSAELYDPVDGRFHAAGSTATPHGSAVSAGLPDGRVILLGAADDPATGGDAEIWTAGEVTGPISPTTPAAGFARLAIDDGPRIHHTATRLRDGRVLIAGGMDPSLPDYPYLASALIVDPSTGRTERVGEMTKPRALHGAVLLPDGRVLIVGGDGMGCPSAGGRCQPLPETAEIFDPATRAFTALDIRLGSGRRSFGQVGLPLILLNDGSVLAITMSGNDGRDAYRIDPLAGTAERSDPAPCFYGASAVRLSDGQIFVQCGGRDVGAIVYDATGTTARRVTNEDGWGAAAGLPDGRVLVLRSDGSAAIVDVGRGDYTSIRAASPGAHRSTDSVSAQLTPLADGRILLTGGDGPWPERRALADASLFDPATGTFTSVGQMAAARSGHTATLLDDGRVLVYGGVQPSPDRTDPEPVTAEIFDPAAAGRR